MMRENGTSRRNSYRFLACVLASALVPVLVGCGSGHGADATGNDAIEVPRNVRVLPISPRVLEEYVTISGPLRPLRGTDLSAEEGGLIYRIDFDKGSTVDRDDVLIMIDRRMLEAEMQAADATLRLVTYNEDRLRKLFEANSASEVEMLQAETELRRAEAASSAASLRYERAAIKAPFKGIVANRYVELGELVVPGMPVARLVDPFVLKLDGAVTEREIQWIKKGTPAEISFGVLNETVEGYVHWVAFEADPLSGKFPVEISVENVDLGFHPGMIGRARLLKNRHSNVVSIPRDAVVQRVEGPVVYVARDGVARQRRVRLGADQGLMVVVEDGLQYGDTLVVRGQRDIRDGSRLLITEEATSLDGTISTEPRSVKTSPAPGGSTLEDTKRENTAE